MSSPTVLLLMALSVQGPLAEAQSSSSVRALTVSPGELSSAPTYADPCLSFRWAGDERGLRLQLAVFDLGRWQPDEPVPSSENAEPVIHVTLPAGSTAWSPSLRDCLEASHTYAWFVGTTVDEASTPEWSAARLFRIASREEVADRLGLAIPIEGSRLPATPPALAAVDRATARGEDLSAPADPGSGRISAASMNGAVVASRAALHARSQAAVDQFGVMGVSDTLGGLAAVHLSGGPDLVLDGQAHGAADAAVRESSLDRASASDQTFDFTNSGAGAMSLRVGGVPVGHLAAVTAGAGLAGGGGVG